MTEYEFLDYSLSLGAMVTDSIISFITVFFAYVLCAYVVGKKITIPQSIGLTFAYSIISLLMIWGIFMNLTDYADVASRYPQYEDDAEVLTLYIFGAPLSLLFAWLLSVIYMVGQNQQGHQQRAAETT